MKSMTDNLEADLEQRVRAFIQEYYEWECFARDNFDFAAQKGPFEIVVKYAAMVDKYCVPEKRRHGGISLGNQVHHLPNEETITVFKTEGDAATVSTVVRWSTGRQEGTEEEYDYEFEKVGGDWYLDQIYLNAPRGRFECL